MRDHSFARSLTRASIQSYGFSSRTMIVHPRGQALLKFGMGIVDFGMGLHPRLKVCHELNAMQLLFDGRDNRMRGFCGGSSRSAAPEKDTGEGQGGNLHADDDVSTANTENGLVEFLVVVARVLFSNNAQGTEQNLCSSFIVVVAGSSTNSDGGNRVVWSKDATVTTSHLTHVT